MDIRKEFLNYFASKGHEVYSSMSLVPDDATLLFTNAGMVQFKDIFTGSVPKPENTKATSCQLCVRAGGKHNDLENVGYTARHHTLFEMLGNFSFGDYFKEDAIFYAWEFITKNLAFDKEKLWVTVHESDDEAFEIWAKHIDVSRIMRFGDKDNFWSMGDTGACGPCSEIFYDQGEENFSSPEDKMGGEGDRFLEIWNLVFMQYERTSKGELLALPKPSIDTGMGLERVVAIKEGKLNNFDSSMFKPLIKQLEKVVKKEATKETIASYRVIADHLRAASFMLSEGILFDKEGRGYVLRRILRRAVRHGYLLGLRRPFMAQLVDTLIAIMGEHYKQLVEKQQFIKEQLTLEEDRFFKTIDLGMTLFNQELKNTEEIFSGEVAFKLYDTFGFPLDLTQDMLRNIDLKVDTASFEKLMNEQKQKAKASWKGSGDLQNEGDFKQILEKYPKNEFVGYTQNSARTKIVALLNEEFEEVSSLNQGESGWVMLEKTPFYALSGGQIGDVGIIEDDKNIAEVLETRKFFDLNFSHVKVEHEKLYKEQKIMGVVVNRYEVAKHHSATHLLQSALKIVLGESVSQAGSLNDASRLRFDFTYAKAMTFEQLNEVEDLVNSMISRAIASTIEELPIELAKQKGAIAMFGEKYGDLVRVVNFGNFSVEFCGGIHVKNTSDIGSFYITKEQGVSAGVRRIEAVCGLSAISFAKQHIQTVVKIQDELKNSDPLLGVSKLKEQIKELKKELQQAQNVVCAPLNEELVNGCKVVVEIVQNGDLKKIVDDLKNGNEKIAVLLLQAKDDKVMIVAGSKNTPIKAGEWIKQIAPIVQGGGGGRADFAQAGGKDASKIEEAKLAALKYAKQNM